MKQKKKIKESQYLWELEKQGMLKYDKELYQPVIDVLDPLFKSGIVTYDEWMDHVTEVFLKHTLNNTEDKVKVVKEILDEITDYYKQF